MAQDLEFLLKTYTLKYKKSELYARFFVYVKDGGIVEAPRRERLPRAWPNHAF